MEQMDHSSMGSMGHMDHGHEGKTCSMNMLFTWDYENLCIVFRWWHITTKFDLLVSFLIIVFLASGYEYLRYRVRRMDAQIGSMVSNYSPKLSMAASYALQVFYSYMLMLFFMTYNGWVMVAVALGAFLGFYFWGGLSAERQMMCH